MNISEYGNVYFQLSNFKKFQENILYLPSFFLRHVIKLFF